MFDNGQVKLIDLSSGEERGLFTTGTKKQHALVFSPDGRMLAVAADEVVQLWDTAESKLSATLPTGAVDTAIFLPEGKQFVTSGPAGKLRLWDVVTGKEAAQIPGHKARVLHLAVTADGQALISGAEDGTVQAWDLVAKKQVSTMTHRPVSVLALNASALVLADAGKLKVLHPVTGEVRATLIRPVGQRWKSFALSPDGALVATVADDELTLWDLASGKERATFPLGQRDVTRLAFSGDGRTLIGGSGFAGAGPGTAGGGPRGTAYLYVWTVPRGAGGEGAITQ
jgi:WD40 repeat protein